MLIAIFPVSSMAKSDHFKFAVAGDIDEQPLPVQKPELANSLNESIFGYWEKKFDIGGVVRTAKIYIAEDTPIRSYYTVIAVPDGVNTAEFIWKAGWKDVADSRNEGLFILEPGPGGWSSYEEELAYVNAALSYYAGANNRYFSIFGEHYFVGYGNGAPVLEAWAVANPVKVISQVYIDSPGLPQDYINSYASVEYGGENGNYVPIPFPEGFRKLTYSETVLPTWYINPKESAANSIAYWKACNDCVATAIKDKDLGQVFKQADPSDRWMTSYMGSISKVAVLDRPVSYWNKNTQGDIQKFMYYYSRYENVVGYANQLVVRADYEALGIELHTMVVNGTNREYMIYVPKTAKKIWGDKIPVMWVWAGNSQTDRVFIDATAWWKVAQDEGFMLVIPCEKINSNAISVSHADSRLFYQQLKDIVVNKYHGDPTRFYSTGQSAGSSLSQRFAVGKPEYYAAVASTSATAAPNAEGNVNIDGTDYPASYKLIPNYLITGMGDGAGSVGNPFDNVTNGVDSWASYFQVANGFGFLSADDYEISGWHDRFVTWTWTKDFNGVEVPLMKFTSNLYRSHNCMHEEMPLLWEFVRHFSCEIDAAGNVTRYYSPSGFKVAGDKIKIF